MRSSQLCMNGWLLVTRLRYTEQFLDDASTIYSKRMEKRLRLTLQMIEMFPESGSRNLPASIIEAFGLQVRKCAVGPFDVIYEYDPSSEMVILHGLVSQKQAY